MLSDSIRLFFGAATIAGLVPQARQEVRDGRASVSLALRPMRVTISAKSILAAANDPTLRVYAQTS